MTAKRDKAKALRFLKKAIRCNGTPSLISIDKTSANTAGINQYNADNNKRIKIRQCQYLNNVIEQDHRHIKRITRATLDLKSFRSAQATLAGIELVAMIKKGKMRKNISRDLSCVEQCYALAW